MEKLDRFLEFEVENNMFQKNVYGFNYWICIREGLIESIICNSNISTDTKLKELSEGIFLKLRKKIKNFYLMLKKHNPMKKKHVDYLFFPDMYVYNPELDCLDYNTFSPIIDLTEGENIIITQSEKYQTEKKLRFPDTCFMAAPALKTGFFRRFYHITGKEKKIKLIIKKDVKKISEKIFELFDYHIDTEKITNEIYYDYLIYIVYSRYYEKLLKKLNPKVIIEVCYYATYKIVLNEVAEKLGIPTVELQHGVMGDHRAYNFLDKNIYGFPKYLFVFSELWKKNSRFPIADENVIVTGSCNIDPSKIEKNRKKKEMKETNTILFIGQDREEFFEHALRLCEIIKEKGYTDYRIIYKLHPCDKSIQQKKERIMEYSDIISVVDMYEKSLYECFLEADIQVGVSSTGIFEGVAYGLTTYIVDTPGIEVVQPLIDMGYAKLIVHEEDILEKKEFKVEDISKVWECHAIDNIRKAINTIIYGKKE